MKQNNRHAPVQLIFAIMVGFLLLVSQPAYAAVGSGWLR